jgi:hypothetical protein
MGNISGHIGITRTVSHFVAHSVGLFLGNKRKMVMKKEEN